MTEQSGAGAGRASVREADGPAGRFLAGVRAALADLPASEVDDILDDVRAHLSDIATELGDALDDRAVADRLGTPAGYAAELRTAAGYPPPPAPAPDATRGRVLAGLAVVGLVASTLLVPGLALGSAGMALLGVLGVLVSLPALFTGGARMTAVAELSVVRSLSGRGPRPGGPAARFAGDLLVAWWVVRALLAAVVVTWVFVDGRWPAVLALALVAVPASIGLGRLSQRDRRLLWLVVPLNVLAVAVALLVADRLAPGPTPSTVTAPGGSSGLYQDDEQVRDIRPVDANGVPLTGVYLFDQDGRPINTHGNSCDRASDSAYHDEYDEYGDPSTAVQPYPRGTAEYGSATGRCVVVPPGPLVVAVPTPTAAPTTTVAPSAVVPTAAVPSTGAPSSVAPPPGAPSSAVPPTR
jgi:uncharacterized membrane protein